MNKNLKFNLKYKNGFGLIALLMAAALVSILAVLVATFVDSQNKASTKVVAKGSCEAITKHFQEYLTSTDNSLWINSVGPNTTASDPEQRKLFAPVSSINIDGLNRYANIAEALITYSAPLELDDVTNVPVPNNFKSIGYLNYNSSNTRLVAMAKQLGVCYNANDTSDGTVIFSTIPGNTVTTLSGVTLGENNAEIKLRVTFGNDTTCDDNHTLTTLSRAKTRVAFKITARTNVGTVNEQKCSSEGSVAPEVDQVPPYVITNFFNLTNCPDGSSPGAFCFHGLKKQLDTVPAPIYIDVQTVQERPGTIAGTTPCLTCLRGLTDLTCTDKSAAGARTTCAAQCAANDPGSIFFCKLSRKEDFATAPWWPCHDQPANVPGTITIDYGSSNLTSTDTDTDARIIIAGLPSSRNYFFDVRALDSYGERFGPSLRNTTPGLFSNLADAVDPVNCACDGSCTWVAGSCNPPVPSCTFPCCNDPTLLTPTTTCTRTETGSVTQTCTEECQDTTVVPPVVISDSNCSAGGGGSTTVVATPTCTPVPDNTNWCTAAPPLPTCTDPGINDWGPCQPDNTQIRQGTCSVAPITSCTNSCIVETRTCGSTPACIFPVDPEDGWGACAGATCSTAGLQSRTGNCEENGLPAVGCGSCSEDRSCYEPSCPVTCDFTGSNFSTCTGACGTTSTQTRQGVCKDTDGNTASGCVDNCNQSQDCTVTCTSSCDYSAATWGNCEPGCPTLPGNRVRGGDCKYSDGEDSSECAGGCQQSEECTNTCATPAWEWGDFGSCSAQNCASNPQVPSQKTRTQVCMLNGVTSTGCTGDADTETSTDGCPAMSCPTCGGQRDLLNQLNTGNHPVGGDNCQCYDVPPASGSCTIDLGQGVVCNGFIEHSETNGCGISCSMCDCIYRIDCVIP